MECVEITVSGRVQRVGFRQFALTKANKCNISGWVKNRPNGDVFVVAQGEKNNLESFLYYLRLGSPMSEVADVKVNRISENEAFTSFEIKF